ncbi:MAG: CrcB family protein [Micromonosporaceae bacterium]|jgi:CrcB protein|nr:CrcB family protein [Micromonosporaceae bacterium]
MRKAPVPAVIAAGGAIGSAARFGLATVMPHHPSGFPWATFATNVAGCFAIGVLMVVVADVLPGRPLLRPFLGIGVLGGFTTFSSYALETQRLAQAGAGATATVYVAGTVAAALAASFAGSRLTRLALTRRTGRPAGSTGKAAGPVTDRVEAIRSGRSR